MRPNISCNAGESTPRKTWRKLVWTWCLRWWRDVRSLPGDSKGTGSPLWPSDPRTACPPSWPGWRGGSCATPPIPWSSCESSERSSRHKPNRVLIHKHLKRVRIRLRVFLSNLHVEIGQLSAPLCYLCCCRPIVCLQQASNICGNLTPTLACCFKVKYRLELSRWSMKVVKYNPMWFLENEVDFVWKKQRVTFVAD